MLVGEKISKYKLKNKMMPLLYFKIKRVYIQNQQQDLMFSFHKQICHNNIIFMRLE